MDPSDLNRRVTSAIFRAEHLPEDSWEAQAAFHDVSILEEEIAGRTSAGVVEGAIAREGAVRAAMRAGEALRALSLAMRYLEDPDVTDGSRVELEALRQQAEGALPDGNAEVRPVRVDFAA
jgi:hypothetical protein